MLLTPAITATNRQGRNITMANYTPILRVIFGSCLPLMLLGGCMSTHVNQVEDDIQITRQGPKELPKRNITDFSQGLRCMDNLFLAFGASPDDYPVLIENIADKTKKVNAGARNMLLNALSEMTKRSRAVNANAFGQDVGTAVALLAETGNKGAYQYIPPFDIAGAISQFDDGLVKKQADVSGESAGTWDGRNVGGGAGASQSLGATVMGLDLHVVTTHNFAILPGVHTRNSVTLYTGGSSQSYDAGINKTGVSFSLSTNRKDPTGQALRALVELSVIELIGKLAKLPYWKCLGLDSEHIEIQQEISDWYFQLNQSNILHSTMKAQMYLRGYYVGDINEDITEEYQLALLRYKQRLGFPLEATVDLEFYSAFLNETPQAVPAERLAYIANSKHSLYEDVFEINRRQNEESRDAESNSDDENEKSASNKKVAKKPSSSKKEASPTENEPLQLLVADALNRAFYSEGDEIEMIIKANAPGYVSCYFQRDTEFVKVFPNRFSTNGFVASQGAIYMPDSTKYSFIAEPSVNERLLCYLTLREVASELPARIAVQDFSLLSINNQNELDNAYRKVTQNRFAIASLDLVVQSPDI